MDPSNFEALLDELTRSGIELTPAVRSELLDACAAIGRAKAGEVKAFADMTAADIERWEISVVREAFEHELNAYARDLRAHIGYVEGSGGRVPINSASVETLEALPAIGRELADRIVAFRTRHGPFKSQADLDWVEGLGEGRLNAIRELIEYDTQPRHVHVTAEQVAFVVDPDLVSYGELLNASGAAFVERDGTSIVRDASGSDRTAAGALIEFIALVQGREEARADAFAQTTEADARARLQELDDFEAMWAAGAGSGDVSCVINEDYVERALELINSARDSIELIMFLARPDDEEDHPVSALFGAIESLDSSRVDVRVILDVDETGDPFHSREINERAMRRLRESGVDVKQDEPSLLTHSKVLVVDGRRCLVGSHNWTWSSFNRYHEVSLSIESADLGSLLRSAFDDVWTSLP